ncbi:MAG TPA: cytochrome c oxidase accessory protein CcoG [Ignavibacteria bacterium]|nr:cytochrome c oxidase accessory protein CcoG [Ignavibacteria bacterium]
MKEQTADIYRDRISILNDKGKRKWIYPKKPSGKFYRLRTILSWFLLLVLFGLPWIKTDGHPFILFNILERQFIIFGKAFGPQDFYLIVIFAITAIVFLILFTIIYGRIFCGWICPQTIFLEMVFRKIEYLIDGDANKQKSLSKQQLNAAKLFKRILKYSIFFVISFVIANTFLSYIIGTDELIRIITDNPANHISGLIAITGFSTAYFLVFSLVREQVCILACPYGRLQGVLLDKNSIVISYDFERGEPRGHIKRGETNRTDGDCVDCFQCVDVCPTGIDIRNGTQLECINCTACIDACNNIMDKVGFEKNLIKYASYNQIKEKKPFRFTARIAGYTGVLIILIGLLTILLVNRKDINVNILRTPGMFFQEMPENKIANIYDVKIYNKTFDEQNIFFKSEDGTIELKILSGDGIISPMSHKDIKLMISKNKDAIKSTSDKIEIKVLSGNEEIDEISTTFMAPIKKQ